MGTDRRTNLYIELEGFSDGSVMYEVLEGMQPSVGHFGPQVRVTAGTAPDMAGAIRALVHVLETNPEVQRWVKTQKEN